MQSSPKQDYDDVVFFGPFRFSAARRLLERDGSAVPLGARALDLLIALVEQDGDVVSQQQLLDRVWPNLSVAESALRVHINKLRNALNEGAHGARYIQNVAGRGYCFVAPISRPNSNNSWRSDNPIWEPQSRLPMYPRRIFGRDLLIEQIAADLSIHRLITIVGPGGVGKTTVASAACHRAADAFDGRVVFVDLGSIGDPELVLSAIRSAFNLPTSTDPIAGLLAALRDLSVLLVLDCCEHLVAEVAELVEKVLSEAPRLHLMTTSREPLNIEEERLYNLPPLDFPVVAENFLLEEVLEYPAIKLFLDCVVARQPGFQLGNSEAAVVASICKRVDGMALAIELAAGRVSTFGLTEVDRLLGGRMQLLWQGRRTAPARHQTLYATLDWSYRLLNNKEQLLLSRLSIFVGSFTLYDATTILADELLDSEEIYQLLASLVERSLLTVNTSTPLAYYRLLDVNRQFAKEKISTLSELNRLARCHAGHFIELMTVGKNIETGEQSEGKAIRNASRLSNTRSALEWCFASGEDVSVELGMRLVAASSAFLLSQGLLAECKKWIALALSHLESHHLGTLLELELQVSHASTHTLADYSVRVAALDRALEIAQKLSDRRRILTLLFQRRYDLALWGAPQEALQAAKQTRSDLPEDSGQLEIAVAEATIACIYSTYGKDLASHQHFKLAFSYLDTAVHESGSPIDHAALRRMRVSYANNLHTCGYFDQASALGHAFIDEFSDSNDYLTAARTLVPIAFIFEWLQDWHTVSRIYDLHERICAGQPRNGILVPYSIMRCKLLINNGESDRAINLLKKHLSETPLLSPARLIVFIPLSEALGRNGQHEEALEIIGQALDYEATFASTAFRSEYLLCKARLLAASGTAKLSDVEAVLRLSLSAAQIQTSISRELDSAMELAVHLKNQRREKEALSVIEPVYARFTEGFATKPLIEAGRILNSLI